MHRFATAFTAILSIFTIANVVQAEHHHKQWFDYLKGKWSYEITPVGLEGEARYRTVAKGNALYARIQGKDGSSAVELAGWDAGRKLMLVSGYGSSENSYWRLEATEVNSESYSGAHQGQLPDGRAYKSSFIMMKVDDDHCEWHSKGETADGKPFEMTGKMTRVTE